MENRSTPGSATVRSCASTSKAATSGHGHLGKDYGTFINHWGHGASPTLYEDLLILLVDHQPNAYLLALDAGTGEERWHIGSRV